MGYSIGDSTVRGDLFTETGKWKYCIAINMKGYWDCFPMDEGIVKAAYNTRSDIRGVIDSAVGPGSRYILVVLEPYHKNSHPQMINLSEVWQGLDDN